MSVTGELREWMRVVLTDDDPAHAIADRIDEAIASEYVGLPKDADGEPIHIGDVMDSKVDYLFDGRPFEVRAMRRDECGWEVYDRLGDRYEPNSLRHHRKQTVEDVLREMCLEIDRRYARGRVDYDALFTEYAEKLREAIEHDRD